MGTLSAQAPARRPLVGSVRGPDGPLAGAKVTLAGFGAHFDAARDRPDVVAATADARGRFHAALLPGVPYVGYAAGAPAADGSALLSPVEGWFGAGALVEFECRATGPFAVTFAGAGAWAAEAPLRWGARPAFAPGGSGMPMLAESGAVGDPYGPCRWPAAPLGFAELHSASGLRLVSLPMPAMADATLRVPPPFRLPVRVVDAAGQPLAGAEVNLRTDGFVDDGVDGIQTSRSRLEVRLGTTGADGTLEVVVPIDDPFELGSTANVLFTASAPGRELRVSGFQGRTWVRDDCRIEADGVRELRFALPAVPPVTGRVAFGDRVAGAGATVRLQAVGKLASSPRSYTHDLRTFEAVVGADGAYAFDGVPADVHSLQALLLRRADELPLGAAPVAGRGPLPTFDLAATASLNLSVLDARHGPAAGHVVYLRQITDDGQPSTGTLLRWCVDGAGRAELSLWPGAWFVFAADATGAGWQRVTLTAGGSQALALQLKPFPVMNGVLLDDAGAPVADAAIELRNTVVGAASDADETLARTLLRAQTGRLFRRLRTAADGSFAIPYPPVQGLTLTVQIVAGVRRTDRFDLVERAEPLQLRWQ